MHLIIIVAASEGILFNKCSKMLYFVQNSYPFQLICQAKVVLTIFLTSLCFDDVLLVPTVPYDIGCT